MLFEEDRVHWALARVCNSEGATLGTAFFVLAAEGIALTCHHLIENNQEVLLDCGDGRRRKGVISSDDCFPEIDVAIVRCTDDPPSCVLPIEANRQGVTQFWTKGFHYFGQDVTDALPASGEISGVTEIQFSTFSTTYRLSNVLVLKNDTFEAGLSGAPVLDPDTGVAFALVNAKFSHQGPLAGFALPFSHIKEHSPKLTNIFNANRQIVPRYGRFLNHLGAAEICRQQRTAVIERLIRTEFFLSELYCERAVERKIRDFLKSDTLILPLIGNAGVGKTMLLAKLAHQAGPEEIVFLLGRELHEGEVDLSAAFTSCLRETAGKLLGTEGDASLLATVLRENGRQLIIVFDGLNEVPISSSLQSWIEHTIVWLEESGSKLLLSARPEFWQTWSDLFPRRLLFAEDNFARTRAGLEGIQVGDFSSEEAEQVRKRYGLSKSFSIQNIQHPLLARIYWEMQREGTPGNFVPTTRYRVLQRFIEMKCGRIARMLVPGVVRAYVESSLQRAARAVLVKGGFEIGHEEFFQLFGDDPNLSNQFMQEGIFVKTNSGIRFVFDEVAEFLQGKLLDKETIIKRFSGEEERPELTSGAVVFAILRFDDEGHQEQVAEAIGAIIAAHARHDHDVLICENIIVQLLPQIHQPERSSIEIEAMAQQMALYYSPWFGDPFNFRRTVANLEVPLKLKLDLLRLFLPNEDSDDFQHRHWDKLELNVFSDIHHTATILAQLIQSMPQPTFEIFIDWLEGDTRLGDWQSVAIARVAKALMFYYRHLAFDRLCELLVRSTNHDAEVLLQEIAREDADETVNICLIWVEGDDPLLHYRAVHLSWFIIGTNMDDALEDKLYRVFSHVIGKISTDIDLIAQKGISRLNKYRHFAFNEFLSRFKQGDPLVDRDSIVEWASTHFDQVVYTMMDLIKAGKYLERCSEVLHWLCYRGFSTEEGEKIIDLLYLGIDKDLLKFSKFRFAIEHMLYSVDSEAKRLRMADFARKIITSDRAVQESLMYFATGIRGDKHRRELQDDILDLLIKHIDMEKGPVKLFVKRIADKCLDRPDPLKYLLAISRSMSMEEFHDALIAAACGYENFAQMLTKWLTSDARLPAFGPTQTFLDKVHSGQDPHEAATSIVFGEESESE